MCKRDNRGQTPDRGLRRHVHLVALVLVLYACGGQQQPRGLDDASRIEVDELGGRLHAYARGPGRGRACNGLA
jgi:hypothetical protein